VPDTWVRTIEVDDTEGEEAGDFTSADLPEGGAAIGGISKPYSTTAVMGPRGKIIPVIRDWREALATITPTETVSWDLETGGLNPWRDPIAVISLYGAESQQPAILHFRGQIPTEVKRFMTSTRLWIDHNGTNFDRPFLACNGVNVFRDGIRRYDTLVGEAVTKTSGRHDVRLNLQATLARRVGRKITKDADHNSWMNESLDPSQLAYCVDDVQFLPGVMQQQIEKCTTEGRLRAIEVEQELTLVVTAMIMTGLPLDQDALAAWHKGSQERIKAAGDRLRAITGDINYGSPVQLKKAFSTCFNMEMASTKAEILDDLGQYDTAVGQFCRDVKMWRQGTKRTGMYDEGWINKFLQYDGRIHARFWQVGTETGRFSSTDPNFQQWPRDGRSVIGGEDGMEIIAADYDAIEVMVAAGLAGDGQLLEDCLDDPHIRLAMAFSGMPREEIPSEVRRIAKSGNFTFLFGGGVKRFHEACLAGGSKMTRNEARELMDWYLRRYSGIAKMRELAFRMADRGTVKLDFPTGLRRVMVGPEVTPTRILNNVVQGTAAAGMKYAMLEMYKRGLVHGYLGATIHDELVSNVPMDEADEYQEQMQDAMICGMERAIRGIPTRAGIKRGSHWR
jgi:DNA polymerase-1